MNTAFWDKHRTTVFSKIGGWRVAGGVKCRDFDLLADLAGDSSYFRTWIYALTGKFVTEPVAYWMESCLLGVSYPDSRIWCNQIAVMMAQSGGGTIPALSASLYASDSKMYGAKTIRNSATYQVALEQKRLQQHTSTVLPLLQQEDAETRGKFSVAGFARPVANGDERIPVFTELAQQCQITPGQYYHNALEIEQFMVSRSGDKMNYAGYIAACLLDLGFTDVEILDVCSYAVVLGAVACFIDARERPPEAFLPLRCEDIDYQGHACREVPER